MADQVDVARGQAARTRANVVLAGGPYLGWIVLGWVLTWAAVELHMLRRLRDTMSLTGEQWEVVIAFCSSLAGCRVYEVIQLSRSARPTPEQVRNSKPGRLPGQRLTMPVQRRRDGERTDDDGR
jgi:hypothetical protein